LGDEPRADATSLEAQRAAKRGHRAQTLTVHTLALDEGAHAGRVMYRLCKKFSAVVVHESVKDAIEHHVRTIDTASVDTGPST
jgi:hypothetical protein